MLQVTKEFYRNTPREMEFDPDEPFENPDYEWVVEEVPDDPTDQEIEEYLNKDCVKDEVASALRYVEKSLYEEFFNSKDERVIRAFKSVQVALMEYSSYKNGKYYPLSDPRDEPDFIRE